MDGMKGNVKFKDTIWHGWQHSQCGSQAQRKLVEIALPEFQLHRSGNTFLLQAAIASTHVPDNILRGWQRQHLNFFFKIVCRCWRGLFWGQAL